MATSSNSIGIFDLNKAVMRCDVQNHEMQRLKYLCTDPTCLMESKMGCADCFLDFHSNHKRVPIENFVRKLSDKFTDVNTDMKRIMENKKLGEFQQELNQEIDEEFEAMKKSVFARFDEFQSDLISQVTRRLTLQNDAFDRTSQVFTEIEAISQQRFEDLTPKEISQCLVFHNDENFRKGIEQGENSISRVKEQVLSRKTKYISKLKNLFIDLLEQGEGNCGKSECGDDDDDGRLSTDSRLVQRKAKQVSFGQVTNHNFVQVTPQNNLINSSVNSQPESFRSFSNETRKFVHPKQKVKGNEANTVTESNILVV